LPAGKAPALFPNATVFAAEEFHLAPSKRKSAPGNFPEGDFRPASVQFRG
jgi:hypothetical protein